MYIVPSSTVKVFGTPESVMADSIRDFLSQNDVRFEWVELRSDEDARREIGMERLDESRLPLVIFRYGDRVERPSISTMVTFLQDGGSSDWP
jgi:thioredoxin reductase (NADPH)